MRPTRGWLNLYSLTLEGSSIGDQLLPGPWEVARRQTIACAAFGAMLLPTHTAIFVTSAIKATLRTRKINQHSNERKMLVCICHNFQASVTPLKALQMVYLLKNQN